MKLGTTVTLTYRGTLEDGSMFGYADAEKPMVFQTGMDQAIDGFEKEILTMIESKGLAKQTKEITVDTFITSQGLSPHPLYLGLRHAKERWLLQEFDITAELKKLTKDEKSKNSKKKTERKKKQVTEQEVTADE